MQTLIMESRSEQATLILGEILGRLLPAGAVLALDGDLGAGKTHFVQGLARGLGLSGAVSSPTFTLVSEHEEDDARLPLYHMDAYRLGSGEEFEEAGLPQYLEQDGITAIEWAEIVEDQLPPETLHFLFRRPAPQPHTGFTEASETPARVQADQNKDSVIHLQPDTGVRVIALTVPDAFPDPSLCAQFMEAIRSAGLEDLCLPDERKNQ